MVDKPENQETYPIEVGGALSRLLNSLVGGDGSVTFSAAAWKNREYWWGAVLVKLVNLINWDSNHCQKAWEWHHERGLV